MGEAKPVEAAVAEPVVQADAPSSSQGQDTAVLLDQLARQGEQLAAMEKRIEELSERSQSDEAPDPLTADELTKLGFQERHLASGTDVYDGTNLLLHKRLRERDRVLQEQVQKSNFAVAQRGFYQSLFAAHRDWRGVNNSPNFLNWLRVNPGQERRLHVAEQSLDAETVIGIFDQFKGSQGTPERFNLPADARTLAVPRPGPAEPPVVSAPRYRMSDYLAFMDHYKDPRNRRAGDDEKMGEYGRALYEGRLD